MSSKNPLFKIAIFGATGHIGKNLISYFSKEKNNELFLFSRDGKKLTLLKDEFLDISFSINTYENFDNKEYDVIINCIGISNPVDMAKAQSSIFSITKFYDDKIMNYLQKFPSTLYINLSSGAIFGEDFNLPVSDSSFSKLNINNPNTGHFYSVSKICSETTHRSLSHLKIIDLRIFGFFSRFIDHNSGFFLSDLCKAIKNNTEFFTDDIDFVRDYIHPSDLYELIKKCIMQKNINDVFDVYSKSPISKSKILEEFSQKYGLRVTIKDKSDFLSPTGFKKNYYSTSRKATKIGYDPQYSSLETILNEIEFIVK